jgi:hypothetical protein
MKLQAYFQFKHSLIIHKLISKSCQTYYVTCSGFKPDKTPLISILYIKNTNKAVSIVVVSSLVFFI